MEVDAKWDEHDSRWVARKKQTYKGVTWMCKGTSTKSKAEARKAWQRAKERKIAEIDGAADSKAGRVKLSKDLLAWYDTYKRHSRSRGRERSARTIQTDEDTITQINAVLGNTLVCDITSDMLQKYFLRLVEDGLSQSTIKKRWNMLSMYFNHRYPDGGNPMSRCTMPQSVQKEKTISIHVDDDDEDMDKMAYTTAEMMQLAAELAKPYNVHSKWGSQDRGYSAGAPLIVCMYEFLRVGEVVELRVKDILWDDGMIYVRRQYDEYHKLVTIPKYNSRRKIPIMRECVDILRAACDGKGPDDLLFQSGTIYNPNKTTHDGRLLRGRLRDNLNLACERVGLERHTIHDLRHDGISRLVDMGVQPQSVQKWAGHKSLSVTLDKYYRHSGVENEKDMALVCG